MTAHIIQVETSFFAASCANERIFSFARISDSYAISNLVIRVSSQSVGIDESAIQPIDIPLHSTR
jgi:hypothetical protein